jgi:hypothetical protein
MKTALIIGENRKSNSITISTAIEVHIVGVTANKLNEAKVEIEK